MPLPRPRPQLSSAEGFTNQKRKNLVPWCNPVSRKANLPISLWIEPEHLSGPGGRLYEVRSVQEGPRDLDMARHSDSRVGIQRPI